MARWVIRHASVRCGGCGGEIPPGQPIALLSDVELVRCVGCAGPAPAVVGEDLPPPAPPVTAEDVRRRLPSKLKSRTPLLDTKEP